MLIVVWIISEVLKLYRNRLVVNCSRCKGRVVGMVVWGGDLFLLYCCFCIIYRYRCWLIWCYR